MSRKTDIKSLKHDNEMINAQNPYTISTNLQSNDETPKNISDEMIIQDHNQYPSLAFNRLPPLQDIQNVSNLGELSLSGKFQTHCQAPKFILLHNINNRLLKIIASRRRVEISSPYSSNVLHSIDTDFIIERCFRFNFKFDACSKSAAAMMTPALPIGMNIDCLFLFGRYRAMTYSFGNHEFIDIPFIRELRAAWPTKYAIICERFIDSSEYSLQPTQIHYPVLYSLSHPRNELLPMLVCSKFNSGLESSHYALNVHSRIVFSDADSALLFVYDSNRRMHSLYIIRESKTEEACIAASEFENSIIPPTAQTCTSSLNSQETGVFSPRFLMPLKSALRSTSKSTKYITSTDPSTGVTTSSILPHHTQSPLVHTAQPLSRSEESQEQVRSAVRFNIHTSSSELEKPLERDRNVSSLIEASPTLARLTRAAHQHRYLEPKKLFSDCELDIPASELPSTFITHSTPLTTIKRAQTYEIEKKNLDQITPINKLGQMRIHRTPELITNLSATPVTSMKKLTLHDTSVHSINSLRRRRMSTSSVMMSSTSQMPNFQDDSFIHKYTGSTLDLAQAPETCNLEQEPLMPELTMHHVWAETSEYPNSIDRFEYTSPNACLTRDMVGNEYFCYQIPRSTKLKMMRISTTDKDVKVTPCIVINNVKWVTSARDLLLVLDTQQNVLVYSGPRRLGTLFVDAQNAIRMDRLHKPKQEKAQRRKNSKAVIQSSSHHSHSYIEESKKKLENLAMEVSSVSDPSTTGDSTPIAAQAGIVDSIGPVCAIGENLLTQKIQLILRYGKTRHYAVTLPPLAPTTSIERMLKAILQTLPSQSRFNFLAGWYTRSCNANLEYSQAQNDAVTMLFAQYLEKNCGINRTPNACTTQMDISCSPMKRTCVNTQNSQRSTIEELVRIDFDNIERKLLSIDSSSLKISSAAIKEAFLLSDQTSKFEETFNAGSYQSIDQNATLYKYLIDVLCSLHSIFVQPPANDETSTHLRQIVKSVLISIASANNWPRLVEFYRNERQLIDIKSSQPQLCASRDQCLYSFDNLPAPFHQFGPMLTSEVLSSLFCGHQSILPALKQVLPLTSSHLSLFDIAYFNVLLILVLYSGAQKSNPVIQQLMTCAKLSTHVFNDEDLLQIVIEIVKNNRILKFGNLCNTNINECFYLIYLAILHELVNCRNNENVDAIEVLQDQFVQAKMPARKQLNGVQQPTTEQCDEISNDGMLFLTTATQHRKLLDLRYPHDLRALRHLRDMLQSCEPILIRSSSPERDRDLDEQTAKLRNQERLQMVCMRQATCAFGRAAFALRTIRPNVNSRIRIPLLCMRGRLMLSYLSNQSSGQDIKLLPDFPLSRFNWAQFHNGVAAGLQCTEENTLPMPNASTGKAEFNETLNNAWIVYNLPHSHNRKTNERTLTPDEFTPADAGFLFGLGLNGLLPRLNIYIVRAILSLRQTHTTIALLLGNAASQIGSSDIRTVKMLSAHVPSFLPSSSVDLKVDRTVQAAAIVGIGLVYVGGADHGRLSNILCREMLQAPKELMSLSSTSPTPDANANNTQNGTMALGAISIGASCGQQPPYPDREMYSLACGMGIGWLHLSCASNSFTSPDPALTQQLIQFVVGGKRANEEINDEPSILAHRDDGLPAQDSNEVNLIYESKNINTHVTAPGACIALAMIYLRSNAILVASSFDAPHTLPMLYCVRPDLLMLRALTRSMIMWDTIRPSMDFIISLIPKCITEAIYLIYLHDAERLGVQQNKTPIDGDDWTLAERTRDVLTPPTKEDMIRSNKISINMQRVRCRLRRSVDRESVAQSYLYIASGACMSMALRYASTHNGQAFDIIMKLVRLLLDSPQAGDHAFMFSRLHHYAGPHAIRQCLNTCVLSLGVLMAGSGNVQTLSLCRLLRKRYTGEADVLSTTHYATGTIGQHVSTYMCAHLCAGFLFLGGGALSFRRDERAIAALLCAVYPRFNEHGIHDNSVYLQALRHLWVLAVDNRMCLPYVEVDTDSKKSMQCQMVEAKLLVTYKCTDRLVQAEMFAPCTLPPLEDVKSIVVFDDSYWPTTIFDVDKTRLNLCVMLRMRHEKTTNTKGWPNQLYSAAFVTATEEYCKRIDCPVAAELINKFYQKCKSRRDDCHVELSLLHCFVNFQQKRLVLSCSQYDPVLHPAMLLACRKALL